MDKQEQQYEEKIVFQPLTEEYLEQSVALTYYSFKTSNPFWQAIPSTYEEIRVPLMRRFAASLPKQTSYIALSNNKVICCISLCDLQDYLKLREEEIKTQQPPLFDLLFKVQGQLAHHIINEPEPEKCIQGFYSAVDPNYKSTSVFVETWIKMLYLQIWIPYKPKNA